MDEVIDFSRYSKKVDIISAELKRIANDPIIAERGRELQRKLGTLTPQDLMRQFDI